MLFQIFWKNYDISFIFQTNIVGEPAWTKSESNEKYYFHNYLDVMPDLNLSNEEVINEIKVLIYLHKWVHYFFVLRLVNCWLMVIDTLSIIGNCKILA